MESEAVGAVAVADRNLRAQLVALGSLVLGIVIVLAKLVAGLLSGSLGLISEAIHSTLDLAASGFTLLAVRAAGRPADREHPYGHGRAENLAAFMQGLLLLGTALGIAYQAALRLLGSQPPVEPAGYAFAVLIGAAVIEGGRAFALRRAGRAAGSPALEADAENRIADVLASLAVGLGLVGVVLGFVWADSVAALLVAGVIGRTAISLIWRSGDILMDRAPTGVESDLNATIGSVPGVREVRSVRTRRSGSGLIGEARVSARRTLSVEAAKKLAADVQDAVRSNHPNVDLTLVVEPAASGSDLVEQVHAAAAGLEVVKDLHNVTVEEERDGSLHVSLHAKMPGHMTLREAAATSAELERRIRAEMPQASRIDIHLEPLEPPLVTGADVTASQSDLADRIRRVVRKHPAVVGSRDVELSSRGGRITAHVVAEMDGDVTLERAHAVETELEDEIRRAVPELQDVVARTTA
jgi:cation diffusion facilitator family transporter